MVQGPIELPATPVTAPGIDPPIGEPVYLGPTFVGEPTVPINIPGLPSVNFGPITSQAQFRSAMSAYLTSVYEKETKRINEQYLASVAVLASTLQKELDTARGGTYAGDSTSIGVLLREINLRESATNQKTIQRQTQQTKANSFYSADFSSKGRVDFIRTVTDLAISGNVAVNVIPRWQESLAATYQARYLGDQISLLNAQAATLREQLAVAQAAEREAQAVIQSVSSELSAITEPARQHLATQRQTLESQFSDSSTLTHAERQAATQAVQQSVQQSDQQIDALAAAASSQINANELAQISQSVKAQANLLASTFTDVVNQLVADADTLIASQRNTIIQASSNAASLVNARMVELIAQVQANPTHAAAAAVRQSLQQTTNRTYAIVTDQLDQASLADSAKRQQVIAGIQTARTNAQTQLQGVTALTQNAIAQAASTYRFAGSAAALSIPGQGVVPLAEATLAALRQGIASAISALGGIASATVGAPFAAGLAALVYPSSTASQAQDQTPARFRYGMGVDARDLGLAPGANLNAIAAAQGKVELAYRLANETRGDGRSYILVVAADGINVTKNVPVRAATLDPQTGRYTVAVPSLVPDQPPITLTWTPGRAPGEQSSTTTTPAATQPVPIYTGVELQPLEIEALPYPGEVPDANDLIITFPIDSDIEPVYLMFSEPLDSGIFTRKQLQKKFDSHKEDFGFKGQNANNKTLAEFRDAILSHLGDPATIEKGTYHSEPNSKVYFNPDSNLVVIIGGDGMFVSGWHLERGTRQYQVYVDTGVL